MHKEMEKYLLEQFGELAMTADEPARQVTSTLNIGDDCQNKFGQNKNPDWTCVLIDKDVREKDIQTIVRRFFRIYDYNTIVGMAPYIELYKNGKEAGCAKYKVYQDHKNRNDQKNILSVYYNLNTAH